jgi:tetratricopeptide (TPR) repeat protein
LLALFAAGAIAGFEGDHLTLKRSCDELEARARSLDDRFFLATALNEQGKFAQYHRSENAEAVAYFQESLALFHTLPNCERAVNSIRLSLGFLAIAMGDYDRALAYLRQAVSSSELLGDDETMGYGHAGVAMTLYDSGAFEEAASAYQTAIESAKRLGYRTLELNHWVLSSRLALDSGLIEAGRAGYETARKLATKIKDRHREQLARIGIARAYSELGDVDQARRELETCWAGPAVGEDDQLTVDILFSASVLAYSEGRYELSANALGAAQAVRETIAWVIPPAERGRWDGLYTRVIAEACAARVDAQMDAGRGLSLDTMRAAIFDRLPTP